LGDTDTDRLIPIVDEPEIEPEAEGLVVIDEKAAVCSHAESEVDVLVELPHWYCEEKMATDEYRDPIWILRLQRRRRERSNEYEQKIRTHVSQRAEEGPQKTGNRIRNCAPAVMLC